MLKHFNKVFQSLNMRDFEATTVLKLPTISTVYIAFPDGRSDSNCALVLEADHNLYVVIDGVLYGLKSFLPDGIQIFDDLMLPGNSTWMLAPASERDNHRLIEELNIGAPRLLEGTISIRPAGTQGEYQVYGIWDCDLGEPTLICAFFSDEHPGLSVISFSGKTQRQINEMLSISNAIC
jgi:hypothetical protein